jgi:hypothetical protein
MYTDLPVRLSLQECVRLLQINPAHFCSASADPVAFGPCGPGCDDFWAERNWSGAPLSRDSLARAILQAEIDVEKAVGLPLTPKARTHSLDAPNYRDPRQGYKYAIGSHLAGYYPRKPQLLTSCPVVLDDYDEDGLTETATITFAAPAALDPAALVFYVDGQFGRPAGRIWPPRDVAAADGMVTVHFDCWQVIDRRYLLLPRLVIVNLLEQSSYLLSISVGVMVEDRAQPQVVYVYDEPAATCGRPDCTACTERITYGVLESIGDVVTAWPARYDESAGNWVRSSEPTDCSCVRFPSTLHITTYHSFCPPTPTEELCDPIKWIVALLAGARVQTGYCECDCSSSAWFRGLQKDAANAFGTRYMTSDALACPWGTRIGEQQAYSALRAAVGLVVKHAAI